MEIFSYISDSNNGMQKIVASFYAITEIATLDTCHHLLWESCAGLMGNSRRADDESV